jgi:hypothetical protein
MSPTPENDNFNIRANSGVGESSTSFGQEYIQDLFAGRRINNATRIGLNAVEYSGWGGAVGGLTGAGLGVAGFKLASCLDYAVKPFMGSFAYLRSPAINYARVAMSFGWRGALAGSALGLAAYGLYEAYEYLKK